jgi:hypothetical protein
MANIPTELNLTQPEGKKKVNVKSGSTGLFSKIFLKKYAYRVKNFNFFLSFRQALRHT